MRFRMNLWERGYEHWTDSGLYPLVGFDVDGVETM
jgi:hypothetical protein